MVSRVNVELDSKKVNFIELECNLVGITAAWFVT